MNPHLRVNTHQVWERIPMNRIFLIKVVDHPMMTSVIFMGKIQMTALLLVVVTGLQMIQMIQIMVMVVVVVVVVVALQADLQTLQIRQTLQTFQTLMELSS
jgi:lysylphosphatidylglycerol synthetase-like protein (DUF2156 family)